MYYQFNERLGEITKRPAGYFKQPRHLLSQPTESAINREGAR